MPNTSKLVEIDHVKEKLVELLDRFVDDDWYSSEEIADKLIAHGVTVQEWISVDDRLPQNFVSVLGYMTDAGEFPPVRECYAVGNAFFFPALGDVHPVSHWCEMPNRRRRMIMSLDRPCVHWNDGYCQKFSDNEVQAWCVDGPCEYEQPSNADRIRAMSDEELRDFLQSRVWICETHKLCDTCPMYDEEKGCLSMLEWLKQPAEETNAPT